MWRGVMRVYRRTLINWISTDDNDTYDNRA